MEPTLELLGRLVEACGLELRIRTVPIDWNGRATWAGLSFDDRLRAVHAVGEFARQAGPDVHAS